MARSGSFGVNYRKTFGTDPSVIEHRLGDLGSDVDGEWVFVKAASAITQYDFVVIASDNTVASLTTTNATSASLQIGVAQVALAANEYGWVWIGGPMGGGTGKGIKGRCLTLYAANANLYTTATAGCADDTATTLIKNVVGLATVGGSTTAVELKSMGYLSVN